ncbi:MAG: class I SAM-dependent methyltransferase [Desulfarculaceae bacterium]|nr:class I SAM-dependent methyltransferase [Desulfarculaceae bacterium]
MGYVFDFTDAAGYDQWFEDPKNAYAYDLEMNLLKVMLAPLSGQRVLDIGCGTGKSLEYFLDSGLRLTGIDPSPYMIDRAEQLLQNRVDLYRGFAEDLPFEDNSFEYSFFLTSLEYTEMPAKAVEEACRVTKDRVFVGVLNRYAPNNFLKRLKSLMAGNVYSKSKFFGIWELKRLVHSILGDVPVSWRTTLQFPLVYGKAAFFVENLTLVQKSPFGAMIGMVIIPVPRFRLTPMLLKEKPSKRPNQVAGYARSRYFSGEDYEDSGV